ncbi:MAG: carboxypeptidase-like regulatory domain-containing protein [Adhaeribacter sp.]
MDREWHIPSWRFLLFSFSELKPSTGILPCGPNRAIKFRVVWLGLAWLIFAHQAFGQGTIKGIIRDNNGKGLAYVSTGLLNATDSKLVKGTLTDESGAYEFLNVQKGDYVVAANMVGYTAGTSPVIKVDLSLITAPGITLNQTGKNLKEVTVTSKRPFV